MSREGLPVVSLPAAPMPPVDAAGDAGAGAGVAAGEREEVVAAWPADVPPSVRMAAVLALAEEEVPGPPQPCLPAPWH